jgi:hypothetical protein
MSIGEDMDAYKVFGSPEKFLKDIAAQAVERPKILKVAQEEKPLTPQEEANEHAQAYWWMGYNWDEIEAILIDMEFPENVVDSAVQSAKRYATEVLKGPFQKIKEGQYIKLKNGAVGVVDCVTPKAVVAFLNDETVDITENHIDWEATNKLSEAYTLRKSADEMVRSAQKDYLVPDRPEEFVPAEVQPGEGEEFTTTIKKSPGAPPSWGEYPHEKEVREVSSSITKMLDQIEAAEEQLLEVKEELKIANEMATEVREKRKKLMKEQREAAQNVFAILGSQNRELKELEGTYFRKYKDKLIGLRRAVVEKPQAPGVIEELQVLKQILEDNHPRIFKAVMAALEEYMEANTTIIEQVEKAFAMFPPRKKKVSQLIDKVKEWAAVTWDNIKDIADELHEFIFPTMDETIAAIDNFESAVGKSTAKVQAEAVIRQMLKK